MFLILQAVEGWKWAVDRLPKYRAEKKNWHKTPRNSVVDLSREVFNAPKEKIAIYLTFVGKLIRLNFI